MFFKLNENYFLIIDPNIESVKLLDELFKSNMQVPPQFPDTFWLTAQNYSVVITKSI